MKTAKQSKGVSWDKREKKWNARFCTKGKQIRLGYYDTEKEAFTAYIEALIEYDLASKLT